MSGNCGSDVQTYTVVKEQTGADWGYNGMIQADRARRTGEAGAAPGGISGWICVRPRASHRAAKRQLCQ